MLAIQGWSQLWQIKKKMCYLYSMLSCWPMRLPWATIKKHKSSKRDKGSKELGIRAIPAPALLREEEGDKKQKTKTSQYIWLVEKVPDETTLIFCFQCSEDISVVAITQVSPKTADLDQQNVMSPCCPLDMWRRAADPLPQARPQCLSAQIVL